MGVSGLSNGGRKTASRCGEQGSRRANWPGMRLGGAGPATARRVTATRVAANQARWRMRFNSISVLTSTLSGPDSGCAIATKRPPMAISGMRSMP